MTAPLLLTVFPSFAVGGAQARFATLANHFGPRWRHAIVSMDGDIACRERLDPALDVEFPTVPVRKSDTIGNVRRFRRALLDLQPKSMLTHNFGSIEWAMANLAGRIHHVHVEDGFGPEERDRQVPRRVWLRRLVLRRRTVVLPSRNLLRIATDIWRLNPRHLRYVPNGIDLARFNGPPAALPWLGEAPVIGTVAAFRAEKNLARLLRAFQLAVLEAPARLVLIGDGPERAALEALAQDLGIAPLVHWAGHVAEPAPLIRALDIFAMSSDTEQMPISLLEAMAAGLPAAATDVGDIRSMLPEQAGPFVTPRDDKALATALRKLISDPALRQTLGAASRAKAEREFDQRFMFAAWAELLARTKPQPAV